MEKTYFLALLKKLAHGDCTTGEQQLILQNYHLYRSDSEVQVLIDDEIMEELAEQTHHYKNRSTVSLYKWMLGIAAIILIAVFTGAIAFRLKVDNRVDNKTAKYQGNRFISLADGSTVIVRANSKLSYPSSFDGLNKREVYLEGQAYFDIKPNPVQPFIVHTNKLKLTVLGTAFNIMAWPSAPAITITVVRGKVSVGDGPKALAVLKPAEQIVYHKATMQSAVSVVETAKYMAWRDESLLFDDVTLEEAAKLLENRFQVKISFDDDKLKSSRFSTTFTKGETLEHLLNSICAFCEAKFLYDKGKALVNIKSI